MSGQLPVIFLLIITSIDPSPYSQNLPARENLLSQPVDLDSLIDSSMAVRQCTRYCLQTDDTSFKTHTFTKIHTVPYLGVTFTWIISLAPNTCQSKEEKRKDKYVQLVFETSYKKKKLITCELKSRLKQVLELL